jgi:ElaB/YqjD/DUF883 family membrane-anchored ribosome-binding protein
MSKKKQQNAAAKQLELAQYQADQAKKRFSSTLGALQYKLKPANIANNAWDGVRDKSSEMADDALHAVNGFADTAAQVVKDRPVAASGVAAGILIFLARAPLLRAASRIFSRGQEDEGVVKADLDTHENYDLAAPTVQRSLSEGVNA